MRADGPDAPPAADRSRTTGLGWLAALYAVGAACYLVLAHRQAVPVISPDEFNYGRVARSIADGDGKMLLGFPYALRSALYLYAIAPAWLGSSTADGYGIAKAIGALALCLTVVPAWLLARELLGVRRALVPAVLVLAGTWMTTASLLLTENLAFPLGSAALAATVMLVRRPGSRWGWAALALALAASAARMQCVVLVPLIPIALVLRAAPLRSAARDRLRADRAILAACTALSLGGLVVALAKRSALGLNAGATDLRPGIGDLLAGVGHQATGLVLMLAIVPVVVIAAAAVRRSSWRDDDLAALLVVLLPATALLLVESAWLLTGFGDWHVQRYLEYVVPPALVATAVALERGHARWRDVGVAALGLGALLALAPKIRNTAEEHAAAATWHRLDQVAGLSAPVAFAVAALLLGAGAALVVRRTAGRGAGTPLLGCCGLLLAALLIQSQAAWHQQQAFASRQRAALPADLEWVDHAGAGDAAGLIITSGSSQWLSTSFFNRSLTRLFAPGGRAVGLPDSACPWAIGDDGTLVFDGSCGRTPQRFLIDDPYGRATFYDQSVVRGNELAGRVVRVPGAPRIRAVLQLPCPTGQTERKASAHAGAGFASTRVCLPALSGQFFLDRPGVLVVRFRGGTVAQSVSTGRRTVAVPPGVVTTIRVPVARGASGIQLRLSWKGPSPALAGAELLQRGARTPLL